MEKRILFVDDEELALTAFRRQLKDIFNITTASSGEQGLLLIKTEGPFAVIVADMRMPGMDGIKFLALVKEMAPDSVRIMLTGNADIDTAINAINEGSIFRFLTKPCQTEKLVTALEDGIRQHQLIISERQLLEKTLTGSVRTLIDILSMINPAAFSRSTRIRTMTRDICNILKMGNSWQVELAAMLSQLGCVTLPPAIMEKVNNGETLTVEEQEMFNKHPATGAKLLEGIPRLEIVAQIVAKQLVPYKDYISAETIEIQNRDLGSQILKIILDYDQLTINGMVHENAIQVLKTRRGAYNPNILSILGEYQTLDIGEWTNKIISLDSLEIGMELNTDVYSRARTLLMPAGTKVSQMVLERLRNFERSVGVAQPINVRVPEYLIEKSK